MTAKSNPGTTATAITLDDAIEHNPPFRAFYVGVSGNLKITTPNGDEVTFVAAPVGILPVEATVIWSTGTAASSVVGLR